MNNSKSDISPLLSQYNNTNNGAVPLIPIDNLDQIRGSGLYNPAPLYPQTQNNGHANSDIKIDPLLTQIYKPIEGELYINPSGAVDIEGTWEKNTNYNLKPPTGDNYEYYDEYQRWAQNAIRKSDPFILPFLFSKINIKFIQDSVIDYVKKARNITIQTRQDTDNLLNLMLGIYTLYDNSNGIYGTNDYAVNAMQEPNCNFSNILGNLNKQIIEKYVQNVLSGLNMAEYYMKDISTLPIPFTHPTDTSIKGSKSLGFVGFFENNHEFTKNIDSFNIRNALPGKIGNNNKFRN